MSNLTIFLDYFSDLWTPRRAIFTLSALAFSTGCLWA